MENLLVGYALLGALVICMLVGIRNVCVYKIRMAILFEKDLPLGTALANHNKLPKYNYMMIHPSQWTLWTVAQYKEKYLK